MPEKVVKTSLRMKESLVKEGKHYCIESGKTFTELIELSIGEYIKNHPIKKS